jgi:hypothetical protein
MSIRIAIVVVVVLSCPFVLFAEGRIDGSVRPVSGGGREIKNSVSAVKAANPGDYILLPSGKRYVLTREEIAIVKDEFDYDDLSGVETETREDGTEVKTISKAHVAYIYPDGQSTHILKTNISFTAFMRHITATYFLVEYIDSGGGSSEYITIDPPAFDVFRASVQFQMMSDGIEELKALTVTAYNYDGRQFMMRYCSRPDMAWGYIPNSGSYKPTGETHQIDFDVE